MTTLHCMMTHSSHLSLALAIFALSVRDATSFLVTQTAMMGLVPLSCPRLGLAPTVAAWPHGGPCQPTRRIIDGRQMFHHPALQPRLGMRRGLQKAASGARMVWDPVTGAGYLLGTGFGFPVGFILGVLGGGGSILALPIFLYALHEPTQTAIAESLVVVSIGAGVGFLAKVKEGVNLEIAMPFAGLAMTGSFLTAKVATVVPEGIRLGMFTLFALTSSISMWQSAQEQPKASPHAGGGELEKPSEEVAPRGFNAQLGVQALGVGALTSMIGAGGGFVIMPALTLVGGLPVKKAVSSSLLIICLNSATAFVSYVGEVPVHWDVVAPFAATVAAGAIVGSAFSKNVSQNMVKKLFSGTVLALCAGLLAWKLPAILSQLG